MYGVDSAGTSHLFSESGRDQGACGTWLVRSASGSAANLCEFCSMPANERLASYRREITPEVHKLAVQTRGEVQALANGLLIFDPHRARVRVAHKGAEVLAILEAVIATAREQRELDAARNHPGRPYRPDAEAVDWDAYWQARWDDWRANSKDANPRD
jgi:hypothetical protein